MGFESSPNSKNLHVNPGLGMAMERRHPFLKEMLDIYDGLHFINSDGTHNLKSIVYITSEVLVRKGLKRSDGIQCINRNVPGMHIYIGALLLQGFASQKSKPLSGINKSIYTG